MYIFCIAKSQMVIDFSWNVYIHRCNNLYMIISCIGIVTFIIAFACGLFSDIPERDQTFFIIMYIIFMACTFVTVVCRWVNNVYQEDNPEVVIRL